MLVNVLVILNAGDFKCWFFYCAFGYYSIYPRMVGGKL